SFAWTIPGPTSAASLVRATSTIDSTVMSKSSAVFTISAPSVSVTSPVGGENWVFGTAHNITWTQNGLSNVKLDYSTNNGSGWTNIVASTSASTGSYAWTVPNTPSSSSLVRARSAADSTISSKSGAVFTVSAPFISSVSPNGGEIWYGGTAHNILWAQNGVQYVRIEYSTNGGTTWTTIISATPASTGSYGWTVPTTGPTTNAVIRLTDTAK